MDYLECGKIVGGPCDGDELWGIGIYQASDEEGCSCKNGITGILALNRKLEIKGKCASRCSLGSSLVSWTQPVNNWGVVVPTAEYTPH